MDMTVIKKSNLSMCLETDFKSIWQVKKKLISSMKPPESKFNSDKIRKNAIVQSGLKHSKWSNFWPSSQKSPQKAREPTFQKAYFFCFSDEKLVNFSKVWFPIDKSLFIDLFYTP